MDKKEALRFSEVLAAYARGEKIEMCLEDGTNWSAIQQDYQYSFSAPSWRYRVEKKPVEFWAVVVDGGDNGWSKYQAEEWCKKNKHGNFRVALMREVQS